MEFSWFTIFVFWVGLFLLLKFHWSRRKIYFLASKIPGPLALPLIGNGHTFIGNPTEMLSIIIKLVRQYPSPFRFWFGPELVLCFSKAEQVEKILTSTKLINKHKIYDLVKVYLGNGLITTSGAKWKHDRKIIQPLFNLKFVTTNMHIHQKHVEKLIEKLKEKEGTGTFDVQTFFHHYFVDIVGEIVLGINIKAQDGEKIDFIKDTIDMYNVGYARLIKPWWHPDIFYNLSSMKIRQDEILKSTRSFINDAIAKAFSRHRKQEIEQTIPPIIDQIVEYLEKNPEAINDEDLLYHFFTLYAASEDTTTLISSALCVCFGMYPEYQEKAAEEIRTILGEKPREIYYEDICKMEYIDKCVKEALRLVPIAPFIIRAPSEDITIDNLTIPTNTGVLIALFGLHYDPQYWEYPMEFYPDHFLTENIKKRHPFAYVPFSGGPRSCIGRILAQISIKYLIAHILQNFEIEADGKFPDIKLRADISTRFTNGCNIRLKKRIWT